MPTKCTLSGGAFQFPDGTKISGGLLRLRLSNDCIVSGVGTIVPKEVTLTTDANGNVSGSLWGNDNLIPSGTVYHASLYDSTGSVLYFKEQWRITGSTLDLGTLVPTASAVSYSGAILTNPTGSQSISSGTLSVPDGIVANVNGNLAGNLTQDFTSAGKLTSYNGRALAGNGIPSLVEQVSVTARNTNIGSTILFPGLFEGLFRINWWAKVRTPGSVSSTLGPLTITSKAADNQNVVCIAPAVLSSTGAIVTSTTANSPIVALHGIPLIVYCKSSFNIFYAFDYAASSGGSMAYDLTIEVEPL